MTCDQIQPLLEAFAGHDLSPLTRWRIRPHLTQCPTCTAELAESVALTARVRDWQNVPAPAGLEARIAALLPAAAPAPARPPLRRAAVGLAGLAAALAAAFWLVPGQPGRPTVAFAEVEQAMQNVQTVSWHFTAQMNDKAGDKSKPVKLTYTNWLRRIPAASATTDYQSAPDTYFDVVENLPMKTLKDDRGYFLLSKSGYTVISASIPASQVITRQIESLTQFPQATIASSSSVGGGKTTVTSFHQENVVVDGQNQIRFDRDIKTVWPEVNGKNTHRLVHVIDWVSVDTYRLVRVEIHLTEDTTGIQPFITLVQDQFQYNTPPPPGVFDWSPPPGAKVQGYW